MAPASVVLPNAKAVIVQDDGTGVMYSGPWKSHTGSSYAGNSYHMSRSAPGAFATFTFTGTEVWIYGDRNHDHGTYSVSVDGVSPVSLDSHAEKLTSQVVLFSQKVSAGKHTVRITNTDPSLVLGLDYFAYVPVDKSSTSTPTTKPPQANETPSPSEPSSNAAAAPSSSSPASTSSRQPDSYPSSTNSKEHSDEVLSHNSDTIHLPGSTASSVSALSLSSSSDQLSASALAHSASSAHVGSLSVVALSIISMASGLVVILLSFLWCLWRRRAGRRGQRPQRDYSRHDYLRHDISQSNETMSTANLVLPTPLIIPHRVQYSSAPSPVPLRPPGEPDSETPHTVPRTGFSEKAHMAIVWNAVPSQFEDAPPEYTPSSPSTSSVPLHDPESHAGPSQRRSEFVSSLPYM
ncbi:hypothetical protein BKA62DRAFT_682111 [Auriculariales sp. MPI-PUGE-AT-0066]|nr:hypothetical protein BKA62DRAFT_682111 [Auriculariales sp. MPI-PUGE-AT-0066]